MTFIRMIRINSCAAILAITALVTAPQSVHATTLKQELLELSKPRVAGNQSLFDEGAQAYDSGDYPAAFQIWLRQAKAGDLGAQRNVAHMLRRGLGTKADPERALYFYERAARAGLAGAALNAGIMRLEADTPYYDAATAAEWLALVASAGSPIAQWELGRLMEAGNGLRRDKEAAISLFKAAADQGHEEALAHLRALGVLPPLPVALPPPAIPGGAVSPEEGAAFMTGVYASDEGRFGDAVAAWAPLAEAGMVEAQYRLARLFQFGLGAPVDMEKARELYQTAAKTGHEGAQRAVDALPPVAR